MVLSGTAAAVATVARRRVRRVHDASRPHHVAARRRRPRACVSARSRTGEPWPIAPCGSSRSTSAPGDIVCCPPRVGGRTTGRIRPRSSPRLTACVCSSAGERRRRSTIVSRKPVRVWSFVASKRAISIRAWSSRGHRSSSRTETRTCFHRTSGRSRYRRSQTGDIKSDEVGGEGHAVRLLIAGHRRPRVYEIENGSRLKAYDVETGRELWHQPLGTLQKAPLVLADGKLYVGSENGKFFIVRPSADRAEVLSEVALPLSTNSVQQAEGTPEPILGGAACRGRVFFVSSDAVYAIGPKTPKAVTGNAVDQPAENGEGAPTYLQVSPTELVLKPGKSVALHASSSTPKDGSCARIRGHVVAAGAHRHRERRHVDHRRPASGTGRARQATVGEPGRRRQRARGASAAVERDLRAYADAAVPQAGSTPWPASSRSRRSTARRCCRRRRTTRSSSASARSSGPTDWSNYTFEADVRSNTRRRQMADIGITAQRYSLVLYGTSQELKLEPWTPEVQRTVTVPYAWKADAWYHLKLRVENLANGQGQSARQGLADRRGGARSVDDRQDGSDRQPSGRAWNHRRRRVRGVFRQPQDDGQPTMRNILMALAVLTARRVASARLVASDPGSGDWPMWGGTPDRNMVSNMKGLPTRVGRQDEEEREMGRRARIAELRQYRRVRRRGADWHQQREPARSQAAGRSRRADGVPRVGRRVPLAAHAREARVGPRERLAVSGRRLVAARRRQSRLLRQQPRRALVCRPQRLPRRQERRPDHRREAHRHAGRRLDLVLRHDGRGRRVPAQHVELVAGHPRRLDLRQHVERTGREPRPYSVAESAGHHRRQQEHRQARLGGQLGPGPHPPRTVVDAVGRQDRRRGSGRQRAGRRLGPRLRDADRQEAVGVRHQSEGFGVAENAQ